MPGTTLSDERLDRMTCECMSVRVRLLNRVITGLYDDAFRPLGVSANLVNILVPIARHGPLSPTDVCRRLRIEKSTLSRDLARMEASGWVEQLAGKGRTKAIRITAEGRSLLRQAFQSWEQAQQKCRELLGPSGQESVLDLAARLGWRAQGAEPRSTAQRIGVPPPTRPCNPVKSTGKTKRKPS